MSNFMIALLGALGASAWVYAKTRRRTGRSSSAAGAAGLVGILAFITMMILLNLVNRFTGQ